MTDDLKPVGRKLGREFYTRANVVLIASELLGKVIYTDLGEGVTGGIITETEAYAGTTDRASHAYGHRRTARTEIMYHEGGVAYVYLCYGIHHLFNVVTHREGVPHAVLIRAVHPVMNRDLMRRRRGQSRTRHDLNTTGPGRVSKALGITVDLTGSDLRGRKIWIEDRGFVVSKEDIVTGARVGVDYAGEDAKLPYRFMVAPEMIKG